MEFADVVHRRRMVRDYDPARPVPPEVRERLLEHAIRAPSAGFSQGWAFLVLESPEERDRFWAATTGDGAPDGWRTRMRRAPLLVVPLSNRSAYLDRYAEPDKGWTDRDEARWPVPYWDVARAVGADAGLTDDELDRIEAGAASFGPTLYMDGICSPAVDVPVEAGRHVRVLARLGRAA